LKAHEQWREFAELLNKEADKAFLKANGEEDHLLAMIYLTQGGTYKQIALAALKIANLAIERGESS
jgi:hypothetical protein